MVDLVLPPSLRQARSRFEYVDSSGYSASRYNGVGQTTSYGGDRVRATIDFTPCGGATSDEQRRRAKLQSSLMELRGSQNRIMLTDVSRVLAGAFPTSELFADSEFGGTANWAFTSGGSGSVSDGVMRVKATSGGSQPHLYQNVSCAGGAAYALRSIIHGGRGTDALNVGRSLTISAARSLSDYGLTRGYGVLGAVIPNGAVLGQYAGLIASNSGYSSEAFLSFQFASFSRCFLVDGGGNAITYSDDLSHANWSSGGLSSISTGGSGAPDGTATVCRMVENSSNSSHLVSQIGNRSAGAADICSYGFFARSVGARNVRLWAGNDGSNGGYATFNLATGAPSTVSVAGSALHARAYSVDAGGGWWLCFVIAELPSATTLQLFAEMENNAGDVVYTGDGNSRIAVWRLGCVVSGAPVTPTLSTSAAVAAASQTEGRINVKAGRTSSEGALAGALLAGDWVEVDGQICMVTSPLNLDSSGRGQLHVSPPPRRGLADNTPIIVHKPMGRFMIPRGSMAGWSNEPGVFSSAQLELEAAFA